MAWPWRKAMSIAVSTAVLAAGLVALAVQPAEASTPEANEPSCLVINAQDELVAANKCGPDLVIPARVKTIKSYALPVRGSISFEANSQLTHIESLGFLLITNDPVTIVLPPNVIQFDDYAIALDTGQTIYLSSNPGLVGSSQIVGASYSLFQPRGSTFVGINWIRKLRPYQIDCNLLSGDREFVAEQNVILELHNCKDPRNPNEVGVPESFGFALNLGLNETATLESLDETRRATVHLHRVPGNGGTRLSTSQVMTGGAFSTGVFGAGWIAPLGAEMTCAQVGGGALPSGVELTPDCKVQSADASSLTSSNTDIVVRWRASPGVANSVEVAAGKELPAQDADVEGTVTVRVGLMKASELSPVDLCKKRINLATFSGGTEDWLNAYVAFNSLPAAEREYIPASPGIRAAKTIDQYENGSESWDAVSAAVSDFAVSAPINAPFLDSLRTRQAVQKVRNSLESYRVSGFQPDAVRREILNLRPSATKDSILKTFLEIAGLKGIPQTSTKQNETTIEYSNPYLVQRFTVPDGVSIISIEMLGAQGSAGDDMAIGRSQSTGFFGKVSGQVSVSPGDELQIGIGEMGQPATPGCYTGIFYEQDDPKIARGGSNPFGGYGGGDGAGPSRLNCATYGGAGGAATVVKILHRDSSKNETILVAAGSAGSAGSASSEGPGGSSTLIENPSYRQTSGQNAEDTWLSLLLAGNPEFDLGGGAAGGGGGAQGGAAGHLDIFIPCYGWCVNAASSGTNSTAGLTDLTAGYVPYTYIYGPSANGKVSISYVTPPAAPTPPVSYPAPSDGPTGGSTNPAESPSISPSPTPNPTSPEPVTAPDAPTGVIAKPFWKGAEVSWKAPTKDGASPITGYQVTASTGQICQTDKLTCRLTGLKPGQLLRLTVKAKNVVGFSAPAQLQGVKVFIPLSLNLWQLKPNSAGLSSNLSNPKLLKPKLLKPAQLRTLCAMLNQDTAGFILTIRLARNASKLSGSIMQAHLATETSALKAQLKRAGLLGKVKIQSAVMPPDSKAKRPSVILVVRKP